MPLAAGLISSTAVGGNALARMHRWSPRTTSAPPSTHRLLLPSSPLPTAAVVAALAAVATAAGVHSAAGVP